MNIRQKLSADDMRERIITVAEEHFRRIGYAKTAVADIAAALGMSPANVYRFFPSKNAINNAICSRLMVEVDRLMSGIIERDLTPEQKIKAFFSELHHYNKATLTHEHRLHDMVEVAMAENWPAVNAHCECLVCTLAKIIAEGVEKGSFRSVDADVFARTAFDASAKVIHPTLIAHCADQDQDDQVDRISDLILAALRP